MHAEAAQVAGHLPRGDGLGGNAEDLGHDRPQVAVGEAAGKESEDAQGGEQAMSAGVADSDGRDAGPGLGGEGLADLGDRGLAVGREVADFLDVEETPGGGEADCRSTGRFCSRLPMPKPRLPLIVVSVLSAFPSLRYCLIFECLYRLQ